MKEVFGVLRQPRERTFLSGYVQVRPNDEDLLEDA